jgi:hypothetical protein
LRDAVPDSQQEKRTRLARWGTTFSTKEESGERKLTEDQEFGKQKQVNED